MAKDRLPRFALLLLLFVTPAAPLDAGTIIPVSTTADDVTVNGNCTLREAVIAANSNFAVDGCRAGSATDTIVLPAGTYTLTLTGNGEDLAHTGDLDIHSDLTINGAGASATIIGAGPADETWMRDRVLHVSAFGNLTLSGVTIRGGDCATGGGIFNAGELVVVDSRVHDNVIRDDAWFCPPFTGDDGFGGAGIFNSGSGSLTVSRSTVSRNWALGTTTSDTTTRAGGLMNLGQATISNSAFIDNFAAIGGAIWNVGRLEVSDTQIARNGARFYAAALMNLEEAALSRTTISDNSGGGVLINGTEQGEAVLGIYNSTVSGNFSHRGRAIIRNDAGVVYLFSSTVADNVSEFGVAGLEGLGRTELRHTIVAHADNPDCQAAVTSRGNNLDSDGSCGLTGSGDVSNTDPLLGPLADNGGPTATHALLAGSPAIDRIPNLQCFVDHDQRQADRPYPRRGACDIGAYEFSPAGDIHLIIEHVKSLRQVNVVNNDQLLHLIGLLKPAELGVTIGNPQSACSGLVEFMTTVSGYVGDGRMPADLAPRLLDAAHRIQGAICR